MDIKGRSGPVFLYVTGGHREDESEALYGAVRNLLPEAEFILACHIVADWDADLSPWPADLLGRHFSGRAKVCLALLTGSVISEIEERFPGSPVYVCGYSLAGLFALWAAYNEPRLAGAICCSGSLWYTDWLKYASGRSIASQDALVYLSLGGKEKAVSDPVMSTIETCTKKQFEYLKADPHVRGSVFEMNSGGHFADHSKRLAKGLAWVLRQEHT